MKRKYVGPKSMRPGRKRVRVATPTTPTPQDRLSFSDSVSVAGAAIGGYVAGGVAAGVATAPLGPEVSAPATLYGGLAAAYAAAKARSDALTKKNMVGNTRQAVTNSLVNKSAMKKTGKTKVKKVKPVKVSPYLRKAIKQVAEGQQAKGYYQRSFHGLVGPALNIDDTTTDFQITSDVYWDGVTGAGNKQTMVYLGHNNSTSDPKTWYGGLFTQNFADAGSAYAVAAMTPRANTDLNFFTPGKIWHAASVLFNGKAEVANPYSFKQSNLKTVYGVADGAIATTVTPGSLKINVLHSEVEFTLKNLSMRTLEVDIYECVPTQKINAQTPLADALFVADNIQDGSDSKMIGYFSQGANRLAGTSRFLVEGSIDGFSLLKGNGWHWTYEKRTMVLQPNEICIHTMKGPSGVLDFKKLFDTTSQQASGDSTTPNNTTKLERTACGLKGWSKHCVIAVRPDPVAVIKVGTTNAATGAGNNAGRIVNITNNVDGVLTAPLYVEVKESMRIAVPEIAGFVLQPLTIATNYLGGNKQPLNLRKPRVQITCLKQDGKIYAGTAISVAREENPAASVTGLTGLS